MSGGSMDYLYSRILDANFELNTPERKAFKAHLEKVAKACKAIEWVDSGDSSEGSETNKILECVTSQDVLNQLVKDAQRTVEELNKWIKSCNLENTQESKE
jgi:hypothetical protein